MKLEDLKADREAMERAVFDHMKKISPSFEEVEVGDFAGPFAPTFETILKAAAKMDDELTQVREELRKSLEYNKRLALQVATLECGKKIAAHTGAEFTAACVRADEAEFELQYAKAIIRNLEDRLQDRNEMQEELAKLLGASDITISAVLDAAKEVKNVLDILTLPVEGEPSDEALESLWWDWCKEKHSQNLSVGDSVAYARRALYRLGVKHEFDRQALPVEGEPTIDELCRYIGDISAESRPVVQIGCYRLGYQHGKKGLK